MHSGKLAVLIAELYQIIGPEYKTLISGYHLQMIPLYFPR